MQSPKRHPLNRPTTNHVRHIGNNTYNSPQHMRLTLVFIAHNGKSLISIFQEFCSSINKAFILAGGLGTGYQSMRFRQFPDIS